MDLLTPTKWVINTLLADGTLGSLVDTRVYDTINPIEPYIYPYIVVQKIPGVPVQNASADIVMWEDIVQVKIVDKGFDNLPINQIKTRILDLLHKQQGSTDAGTIIGCVIDSEFPLPPELEGKEMYFEHALRFRVFSQ